MLPRADLPGVHIEPLRQLREGAFVADGGERHLGLEDRGVVAGGTFDIRSSWLGGEHVVRGARLSTLPICSKNRDHFSLQIVSTPNTSTA